MKTIDFGCSASTAASTPTSLAWFQFPPKPAPKDKFEFVQVPMGLSSALQPPLQLGEPFALNLSRAAAARLTEALDNPPEPGPKLRKAMRPS